MTEKKSKKETNERKYTILLLTENICKKCSPSGKMSIYPLCFISFISFLFFFLCSFSESKSFGVVMYLPLS